MIENEDHDRASMELPGQQAQLLKDAITFWYKSYGPILNIMYFFSLFQIL